MVIGNRSLGSQMFAHVILWSRSLLKGVFQRLLRKSLAVSQVFYHWEWWGVSGRHWVCRCNHQIRELGLALVEELLKFIPGGFIIENGSLGGSVAIRSS